jgi:photosystem II stability/assembly factor-like uncharacterized protein
MTMAPVRGRDHGAHLDPAELLIQEARLEARRRRLRYVIATLVVVAAVISIWWGSGGGARPAAPPRVGTSSPPNRTPTGSSNGSAPIVLDGQSVNQVVAFGPSTLWVLTANEVATSGGGQGIELTTNAGRTWTDVTPPGLSVDGGSRWMVDFGVISPTSAWVVYGRIDSGPQRISTTDDSGRTWSKVGLMPTAPGGCELQFVNVADGTCTVLGGAAGSMTITIYRTASGGEHWQKVYANTPNTSWTTKGAIPFGCDKNIDFTSAQKGFALFFCNGGSGAIVEESLNGGATWDVRPVVQPSSVPEGGGGFSGPPVFAGSKGAIPYAVGNVSEIYVTDNGGRSFHPVYPPGKPKRWAEDIVSPTTWRLMSGTEILATDNAGASWFTLTSKTVLQSDGVTEGGTVQFATAKDGWVIEDPDGTSSRLLRTSDGGRLWRKVTVPGTKRL